MTGGETIPSGLAQRRTALVSVAAAAALVALKLGTGLAIASVGLISAGIESSGDVVAAVLTFFAIRLGGRPADREHPFGHRRAENLAALGEAAILFGGGIVVVVAAIERLAGSTAAVDTRWQVFAVIGLCVAVDISRTLVSLRGAAAFSSAALRSNAFHFAGDLAGSVAVLVGLLAVRGGLAEGDAIAALVVAGIIFAAACRLIVENARVLMDTEPADARARAVSAIRELDEDVELRRLRLRESGGRYFADVVAEVSPGLAVIESHATADAVEAAVRRALPHSDVVVHLEPRRHGLDLRDRVLAAALAEPLVREAHDITIYQQGARISVSLHLKFAADVSLTAAHEIAERVEAAVRADPGVEEVQTHLEPLEQPRAAHSGSTPADLRELDRIGELVRARAGRAPLDLELLQTDEGPVAFLSVQAPAEATLTEAHDLASRLEDDIRAALPQIVDVVVHTEP